jgi:YidC/Oxa1 family membrane protein insertase
VPLLQALKWINRFLGNYGWSIIVLTIFINLLIFPLRHRSMVSMRKMQALQPEMKAIQERYAKYKVTDPERQKMNQEMMALYKQRGVNPASGCVPMLLTMPVLFAFYSMLQVAIELRGAPFFGWIHDLSAPDPTNLFNLFGLIPFDPTVIPVVGQFLHIGVWPLIMGVTMWFQMKLNPSPPDPTQKMIFDWMPLIFTFMLASFSAGLVIYWAWNNTLSVLQQSFIMHRHGAKIELFDNIKSMFVKKKDSKT